MSGHLVLAVCIAVSIPHLLAVSSSAAEQEATSNDEEKESFLLNAEVVRVQQMLPGSTYPMAIELRGSGTVRRAAFKYRPADLPHTEDIAKGQALPDSYLYEASAYRLDRELGIGMVPVAVIRDVHAEGAVIEWIEDATPVNKFGASGIEPDKLETLARQQAVMRLFDALILNEDRKESDQLFTTGDGKLHLLDHSRSFGVSDELPQAFLARPASLPRSLLRQLAFLNFESLSGLLEGLVTETQIRALLERRDRILEKISADREDYGDSAVFQD